MRKKFIYLFLLGLIISTALYVRHYNEQQDYERKYHISINETSIEGNLQMWLNRDDGMNLDPEIFDIQRLGTSSTYMVLYKLGNDKFGAAQLIKGRNNKLRIKQASSGDLLANKVEDIKTNKGRYFLVMGKNPDLVFDHIEVIVDYKKSYSYLVDVSNDEFFYNYKKIPEELDQRTKVIYYDKNNKEFTDDQLRIIF